MNFTQIASGRYHSLISVNGVLHSCGMPRNGVLGINLGLANSDQSNSQPQRARKKAIDSNYSSVSTDNKYKEHQNFKSIRNKVSVNTVFGRLNPVSRLKKVVIGVAAGPFHSLAWTSDGQLYSWGKAQHGCLGYQISAQLDFIVQTPTLVPNLSHVQILKACCGQKHSIALSTCGKVYSWGYKQVYSVATNQLPRHLAKKVIDSKNSSAYITDIQAGLRHSAALCSSGELYLWGDGKHGCTMQNNKEHLYFPTPISSVIGSRKVVRVGCGDSYTVLVTLSRKQFSNPKIREIYFARSALKNIQRLDDDIEQDSDVSQTEQNSFKKVSVRLFDKSGRIKGAPNSKYQQSNQTGGGMTSVKKILKKQFITKEMKQKVLDRMQFRKKSYRNLTHQDSREDVRSKSQMAKTMSYMGNEKQTMKKFQSQSQARAHSANRKSGFQKITLIPLNRENSENLHESQSIISASTPNFSEKKKQGASPSTNNGMNFSLKIPSVTNSISIADRLPTPDMLLRHEPLKRKFFKGISHSPAFMENHQKR